MAVASPIFPNIFRNSTVPTLNPSTVRYCLTTARNSAIFVLCVSFCGFLGWVLDLPVLKGAFAGGITIKANTTIGLGLLGLALWFQRRPDNPARWQHFLAAGCALLVALLGTLTLLQHFTGADFGIDQLFFPEAPGALATASPGRMGPPAAICLLLAGIALFRPNGASRSVDLLAHFLASLICLITAVPLIGYAFGVDRLYGLSGFTGIAFNTAAALLAMGIGIILSRPTVGLMVNICADDAGGAMARRLLLPIFFLPIIVWWFRIQAEKIGWIDTPLARPLAILFLSVCSVALLVFNAKQMSAVEAERRRAEEEKRRGHVRIAEILESINDAFYALDAHSRFTYVNAPAERLWGKDRATLIGKNFWTEFPEQATGVDFPAHREVLSARQARHYETFSASDARWFDVSVYPESSGGLSCFIRDVTDNKQADAEIRRARDAAEKASQTKSEFLAALSHEMRTPLNPVLLTLDYLAGHPQFPKAFEKDLASMRRNIDLEIHLISDLLDITRIETGKFTLNIAVVDFHEVIREAVRMCESVEGPGINLELAASRHFIRGDAVRLHQIVWNLLTNAQKFTEPKGRVSLRTSSPRPETIRLEVADTGCGISPEMMSRLFNAFEQGESQTGRQRSGLGLGLSITRKIVEAHGGSITASSEGVGRGASFVVELQARDAPVAAPKAAGQGKTATPFAPKLRMLLVEDHPPTLHAMSRLLKVMGHEVTGATSCHEAEAAARSGNFDLLISDIGLPDGSGLDIMQRLGSKFTGRAIALSGYGMEADINAARNAGFTTHLTKPIKIEQLADAITRTIDPTATQPAA